MRPFGSVGMVISVFTAAFLFAFASPAVSSDNGLSLEETRSLDWLRAQIVPNALIPAPAPQRRGLILSYAPGTQGPSPIHRKCFVYDAAVASLAFGMAGDWSSASTLLQALARVQRSDGSFWFSYNVDDTWPEDGDHDMAIVRAGATAWVGYAFSFYLEKRPAGSDTRVMRERTLFLTAARHMADFLLNLQITGAGTTHGLIRGGQAFVKLQIDAIGSVTEVYDDSPVPW
ncbi:MAG: hypothetical protein ACREJU_20170, partial [Nitrospiraceae bacterium]